jgi:hypothetical protein
LLVSLLEILPSSLSKASNASEEKHLKKHALFRNCCFHLRGVEATLAMYEDEKDSEEITQATQIILDTCNMLNFVDIKAGVLSRRASFTKDELFFSALFQAELAKALVHLGLSCTHQLKDRSGAITDIVVLATKPGNVLCPIAVMEFGRKRAEKKFQALTYVNNLFSGVDANDSLILSAEIIFDEPFNSLMMTIRISQLDFGTINMKPKDRKFFSALIYKGSPNWRGFFRCLRLLSERPTKDSFKTLGPNCLYDRKSHFVYKCLDYRENPISSVNRRYHEPNSKFLEDCEVLVQVKDHERVQFALWRYPFIDGSHTASKVFHFQILCHKVTKIHAEGYVYGDIRSSNIVFTKDSVFLIDFDLTGKQYDKCYPPGFNVDIRDGKRHPTAKPDELLCPEHDWYSLAHIARFYTIQDSSSDWESVCLSIENGCFEELDKWDPQLELTPLVDSEDLLGASGSPNVREYRSSVSNRH